VLVSFGGSDPANATSLALDALVEAGWTDRAVDIVIGRVHAKADEIAHRCAPNADWSLYVDTPRLGELMRVADLALGAGGTSTWERCASGLPTLVVTIADNQRASAAATEAAGACRWLGDVADVDAAALAGQLRSLEGDSAALQAMSRAARALCDGQGTRRVARAVLAGGLTFRSATVADEDLTLEWRNHPTVRQFSGAGSSIAPDDHRAWLTRVVADPGRALLIAQHQRGPLAVVRFDDLPTGEPEVSVYLDPAQQGSGWGTEVLIAAIQWLKAHHRVHGVRARIHADNAASQRAFVGAGFRRLDGEDGFQRWLRPVPIPCADGS
jgi:UDP-2,4-diacetamido-2,4,6-trideoxy-beta-L-altropyranose hydrolase